MDRSNPKSPKPAVGDERIFLRILIFEPRNVAASAGLALCVRKQAT